ncbi:ergot alkaloid biosynthesis protein [Actinoplanes sp. NBRC 101535]|uniref:ergot alkaloid biosynthesis protein n=1 Tax=Actinoplanes sp. NBRC 101535 TaxID=3032196 RepID=UPI0024A52842|nr:ergot alkaloid biosynthesis protein [Actinoplanes sp. NBRC 101535]GLY05408.1 oxidoreductase [Actinoplanes sp. NBRC 101535]
MRTLVVGAAGKTGSRVAGRLREQGREVVAASRSLTGFDWYEPDTHDDALSGVDSAYLVAPVGDPDPVGVMGPFLERAARQGVRRIVLLSVAPAESGGPGLGRVHALVPTLFAEWAVLRPTWFMQNLVGAHPHARSIADRGELITATGDARVALIDVDDIADVAVRALTGPPPNTDWLLTGPEAVSYTDVAAVISEVTGVPLRHRAVEPEELRAYLETFLPAAAAARMAGLDRIIASGSQKRVTGVVEEVTGRPARTLWDWAVRHRSQLPA